MNNIFDNTDIIYTIANKLTTKELCKLSINSKLLNETLKPTLQKKRNILKLKKIFKDYLTNKKYIKWAKLFITVIPVSQRNKIKILTKLIPKIKKSMILEDFYIVLFINTFIQNLMMSLEFARNEIFKEEVQDFHAYIIFVLDENLNRI